MKKQRDEITPDWVLEKWRALAFAPVGSPEVPPEVQLSALNSIAGHLGMFDEGRGVLEQLSILGRSTLEGIVNVADGQMTITDFDRLSANQLATIKSVCQITSKDGGSLSIELHDPNGPLGTLAQLLGMFKKPPGDGPDIN